MVTASPSSDGSLSDQCPCFINIGKLSLHSRHIGTLSWYGCLVCPLCFSLQDVGKARRRNGRGLASRLPLTSASNAAGIGNLTDIPLRSRARSGWFMVTVKAKRGEEFTSLTLPTLEKWNGALALFRTGKVIHGVPLPSAAALYLREFSDWLQAAWLEMRCVLNRFRPSGHLLRLMAPDRWRAVRFGGVLGLAQVTDRCRISPRESLVHWCQVPLNFVYKWDLSLSQMFTGWWSVSAAYERIRSFSFAEWSQTPPLGKLTPVAFQELFACVATLKVWSAL